MQVSPLTQHLGARIDGIDLAGDLTDERFDALYAAWLKHAVLVIPQQHLSEDDLVTFSTRFGPLEQPPAGESRARDEGGASRPEIWNISNVKVDGVAIGSLGNAEADWHTDMSYIPNPPAASILYAREIPTEGGNTQFADMRAAMDELPAHLRTAIEGKSVRHDSAYTSVGELRKGAEAVTDVTQVEGAIHDCIRVHPESGRPALYFGRRMNASVVDMPVDESEALLDEVWAFCSQPEFVYTHVWSVGDLVMWDNRSVIHRRDAFDDSQRRVMWRTQVGSAG